MIGFVGDFDVDDLFVFVFVVVFECLNFVDVDDFGEEFYVFYVGFDVGDVVDFFVV